MNNLTEEATRPTFTISIAQVSGLLSRLRWWRRPGLYLENRYPPGGRINLNIK